MKKNDEKKEYKGAYALSGRPMFKPGVGSYELSGLPMYEPGVCMYDLNERLKNQSL